MKIKQLPEDFKVEEVIDIAFGDKGEYCYFLLTKKDRNTLDVVRYLEKQLGKRVYFAGIKDKNAVTKQYIAVKSCNAYKVLGLKIDNATLELVGYSDDKLLPKDIVKNKFEIVVRGLDKSLNWVRVMPNYFGEQRFGMNCDNYVVGRMIVQKKFKDACELLGLPVSDPIRELRKKGLMLKFYLHAYQSYLFNLVLSRHIGKEQMEIKVCDLSLNCPAEKFEKLKLPLVSFDAEFPSEGIRKSYLEILEGEGISLKDFVFRSLPELVALTEYRDAFVEISGLDLGELEDDELNTGKYKQKVVFELPRGSYATVALRCML